MDKQLVTRIKEGDKSAFDLIYEQYKNLAMRTACFITGNKADAEDIVQESFIKCYQNISKLKKNEEFKSWLLRILTRTAWKYCKKQGREIPKEDILDQVDTETEKSSLELVLKKEDCAVIMSFIRSLPPKQRIVIVLYYYDEMSTKDIARVVGCLEGTVKSRLFTARKTLRREMMQYEKKEEKEDEKRCGSGSKTYASL